MMERDDEAISEIDQLMYGDEYKQRTEELEDFINFVYCNYHGNTSVDGGKEEEEKTHVRYSSRDDILPGLKDILRTIPRYNMKKSVEHIQILDNSGLPLVLAELLDSSVKEHKEIAKECIKLFLIDPKTNSGFFFPRSIQNQCVTIVLTFCGLFRGATCEDQQQLYCSCRETLASIMKSIAFSDRKKHFGIANTVYLIVGLYKCVYEVVDTKLHSRLESTFRSLSSLSSNCNLRSLEKDFQEFALLSHHLCRVIEDHLRERGLTLPVNVEDLEEGENPCYLTQFFLFYCDFSRLLRSLERGLHHLEEAIRDTGGKLKFNTGWSLFLSVLKELHNISKLYRDGKERLSAAFQKFPLAINYVIRHSKRGYDHLWLLNYESAIDFESRRHVMVMMFPEVKDDDEKLHKLLIDRSLLFKESFELIAHVNPKSLHNGLFVEFKDEVATGHGVLREWLLLVCQALFSPENSLFVECPEDRRRFFPNPTQLKPVQLDLLASVVVLSL